MEFGRAAENEVFCLREKAASLGLCILELFRRVELFDVFLEVLRER